MDKDAPIFVKIREYKGLLNTINILKSKLNEAKNTLARIHDIKSEEDSELELWSNTLDGVKERIEDIDRRLFEPEV